MQEAIHFPLSACWCIQFKEVLGNFCTSMFALMWMQVHISLIHIHPVLMAVTFCLCLSGLHILASCAFSLCVCVCVCVRTRVCADAQINPHFKGYVSISIPMHDLYELFGDGKKV